MQLTERERQPRLTATAHAVDRECSSLNTLTASPAESADILSLSNKIHYYARKEGSWH